MAAYHPHQQAQQQQRLLMHMPIVNGPSPYYDPPWPATEEPSPLAIRLHQLRSMPPSEIRKVPVADLIEIRTFQENILDEYKDWASQQRFGRIEHLNRCAEAKLNLRNRFTGYIRLAETYADDVALRRQLESAKLAKGRFPSILTWLEKVERAVAENGYLVQSNEADGDLQEYQSGVVAEAMEVNYVTPASGGKTRVKSTKTQSKVTKPAITRRQNMPTKSRNEALLASLQEGMPKEGPKGFRHPPPLL